MEKRNFVTNARTPEASASDIDDILEAGARAFGSGVSKVASAKSRGAQGSQNRFEKRARAADELSDS